VIRLPRRSADKSSSVSKNHSSCPNTDLRCR
jgi:hypothetical protein